MSNFIKAKIVESGMTMTDVVKALNEKGREGSIQNLSQKLSRGSLRYDEAVEIADIIGQDIDWRKKQTARQKQADEIILMDLLGDKYDDLYKMGFEIVRKKKEPQQ